MKKVFILDDDEDIVEVLKHILSKQYELRTQTVSDGVYEAIFDFKPDLIIVDNFIGSQNAHEILEHLRTNEQPIVAPVVLFSAAHNIQELADALGTRHYLAKPASIHTIRELVKRIVD